MKKTAFKIFISFTLTASIVSMILLIVNFLGFAYVGSDVSGSRGKSNSYRKILEQIGKNLVKTEDGYELEKKDILPADYWCILIDETGKVIWSQKKPEEIPMEYSINDVARMTKWYLKDYPVYVRTEDYGLLVLGTQKDSVGKYEIIFSMEWFETLPERILNVLTLNLCLAVVLAFFIGITVYRRLYALMNGISDLWQEKPVKLEEKGIFKELARNINSTSETMIRKNEILAARDNARLNWIAGISHDIRTPLALVMGNAEAMEDTEQLSEENKKRAENIKNQSMKIKKLIEDLNLISSLEYDMWPAKKKPVRLCPFTRKVVSDIINSGMADTCEIVLDLQAEKAIVLIDQFLMERAVFNIINNSIIHNENGCKISISVSISDSFAFVTIADNGNGVPDGVLKNITEMPKSAHGLGLPMAYRIVKVHGGMMKVKNEHGFRVEIRLPVV